MAWKSVALLEHTSTVVSQLAEEKFYSCTCNKNIYTYQCSILIICSSVMRLKRLERSWKTATTMTKGLENPPYSYSVRTEPWTIQTEPWTGDTGILSFCSWSCYQM